MQSHSHSSTDLETRCLLSVLPRENSRDYSQVELRCGLVVKKTNSFILRGDNVIQYKILYKTNADCNNYWHEIGGDNAPLKEDKLRGYFDGARPGMFSYPFLNKLSILKVPGYDDKTPHVAFEISVPSGQIATFRILARVFQSGDQSTSPESKLPTEIWASVFSHLSLSERQEYVSSVCKSWREVLYSYSVTLPGAVYVEPKEVTHRAAEGGTTCWRIRVTNTPANVPSSTDALSLAWQSSELNTQNHIYTSFVNCNDNEVTSLVPKIAATHKLYVNSHLLKQNHKNELVPVDVRAKFSECGLYSATNFVFCKALAANSIVISVVTAKQRVIQPVEVLPTDKFGKLFTLLRQTWKCVEPREMKFQLRRTGQRLDWAHSEQTFAQLGITNFSWLRVDFSHPDVIPVNVYQISGDVITITVKSTMTRKAFKERVHQITGTDPSKSRVIRMDANEDEPIGKSYSKENHLFAENICFLYEDAKAKSYFEYSTIGGGYARQANFDLDAPANNFHKYLVALGECNIHHRLRKKGGRVLDKSRTLRENGIESYSDRIDILL